MISSDTPGIIYSIQIQIKGHRLHLNNKWSMQFPGFWLYTRNERLEGIFDCIFAVYTRPILNVYGERLGYRYLSIYFCYLYFSFCIMKDGGNGLVGVLVDPAGQGSSAREELRPYKYQI